MPDKEVVILSEEAVDNMANAAKINYPLRQYLQRFGIDVGALCQTVRALRAELTQAYYEDCEICEKVIISENGAEVLTFIVCGRCWNSLQARLKEVEGERDALITDLNETRRLAFIRGQFRARAINLCKEKAAEWAKASNEQWDERPDLAFDSGEKVRAANELREALEHLDQGGS